MAISVRSYAVRTQFTPNSVDELELDGVTRAQVVAPARGRVVHDADAVVDRAERERVRVAVDREQRVTSAVTGGVGVGLLRRRSTDG